MQAFDRGKLNSLRIRRVSLRAPALSFLYEGALADVVEDPVVDRRGAIEPGRVVVQGDFGQVHRPGLLIREALDVLAREGLSVDVALLWKIQGDGERQLPAGLRLEREREADGGPVVLFRHDGALLVEGAVVVQQHILLEMVEAERRMHVDADALRLRHCQDHAVRAFPAGHDDARHARRGKRFVKLALHRRRTGVDRVLVRRLQFLFLQVDQRRPGDHQDDLLLRVRCVRDLEFLDADRHQCVIGPRQERRDHAADDFDLAQLVGQLRQGRGKRQSRLLLGDRRMVVVLEGRHVIRPFHRLRVPGRKHERLVSDPHERRGTKLKAVVIQQNESAGVVQAVVETLRRDAD